MKLRVFAVVDPPRLGGHRTQEAPKFQGLVKPADARRMVGRGSARFAVIKWARDDLGLPRFIRRISPEQAHTPRYQTEPDEEVVVLVPRERHDGEPERRHARRRDLAALHLLRLDQWERPDPQDDMTHYCRTGHARSTAVLAPRLPAPDPIAVLARQAAGGSRLAPTGGWRRGHGGGHQSIAAAQSRAAVQRT